MSTFADTNWLESLYIRPHPGDPQAEDRHRIATRRMRIQAGPLFISHIVLLEARNVFGRVTGVAAPSEWEDLLNDFNGRIFVDPMNWDLLRQQTNHIFERFSHRAAIGTFDATLIASVELAGGLELLSFDEQLKALATCLEIKVFPELTTDGKTLVAALKRRA